VKPVPLKQLSGPSRIDVNDDLSRRETMRLADDPNLKVIQTVQPLSPKTWKRLNESVFEKRPDVECRVYGHYTSECDLSFTQHIPHVRRFAADSLRTATNVEALAKLRDLESLSLGIYEMESFEVLQALPSGLHRLSLSDTRSKKPDLAPLARFKSLRTVYLEGHTKNIEVLSELRSLEDVTLRSTTTADLSFLTPLVNIWSLDIKLGGTTNLGAIAGLTGIKYLELWQIRGLTDIGVISDLPGLQNLFLQSLPHIKTLPSLDRSARLRRVVLENMKGITDLSSLEHAPALEDFGYVGARGKDPSLLLPVLRNKAVSRVWAGFGSEKKNKEFARLRENFGKASPGDTRTFAYL
jgi:hypothetical protein